MKWLRKLEDKILYTVIWEEEFAKASNAADPKFQNTANTYLDMYNMTRAMVMLDTKMAAISISGLLIAFALYLQVVPIAVAAYAVLGTMIFGAPTLFLVYRLGYSICILHRLIAEIKFYLEVASTAEKK